MLQAKPLLEKDSIEQLIDPTLGDAYNKKQLNRLILIAAACIHQSSNCRPQMSQACSFYVNKQVLYVTVWCESYRGRVFN